MHRAKNVKLVLFDAGGVLLLPEVRKPLEALERLGLPADVDAIDRAHYAGMAAVDEAMRAMYIGPGGLTSQIWMDGLRDAYRAGKKAALGLPHALSGDFQEQIFEASWTRIAPGGVEVLRAIAERELSIAVVSNAGGTVEADLRAAKICQVGAGGGVCVTAVIDSSVVGVAKPDPAIFSFALEAAGRRPQDAVFIGDSVEIDVRGAMLAGIRALHFDPYGLCADADHDDVDDLTQLAELVTG